MELLSPAGHWEAMVAAVQSGAGAVYMGFGDFNARRGAKNFTPEEFQRAVDYCHLRGVKVYLTLNTLLTDRELPAAEETPSYMQKVAAMVDGRMNEILQSTHVSRTDAAVLAAVNIADEYLKSQGTAENLRAQLKGYLDDATKAKNEASELKREVFRLQQQLEKASK